MLFYNQIKREFSQGSWKRGQICYRQDRVKEVRLEGTRVVAKVHDQESPVCETEITMGRGTILQSTCSCPKHQKFENHCPHVAALSIWVVERGSLLRAGVEAKPQKEDLKLLQAKPVLYVRALFSGQKFTGLSLEPALRYLEPSSKEQKVEVLTRLVRQSKPSVWKTMDGHYLKAVVEPIPMLQSIENPKLTFLGSEGLEKLSQALAIKQKGDEKIILHPAIQDVVLGTEPLKLETLHIGRKEEKSRTVSYVFSNSQVRFTSQDLMALAVLGKVSSGCVWKGNIVFKFATPLKVLNRFANRTGVNPKEKAKKASSTNIDEQNIKDTFDALEAFSFLEDNDQTPLHPLVAYRLSLELGVDNFTVDADWTEFHEWKKNFEKKKIPPLPKVDYGFSLRDYQQNGLSWLWSLYHRRLAALLADDMGLGKTHQVMAFLTSLYSNKKTRPDKPSLVIAPTSVVAAWKQKLEKYPTGLKWYIFHGKDRSLPELDVNIVLTTYGILQKETVLREREWHVVLLDEAQAVKNPTTISSRASRVLKSNYRIALTGTPVENQAVDLWSIMEFLLPGYLGSIARFRRLYGYGRDSLSSDQAGALRRLVNPFLLRRTKSQVLKELPEKTEEILACEMTPIQIKAYKKYLNSHEAQKVRDNLQGQGKIDYASVLALLTRLKQVCDHPKLPDYKTTRKIDPMEAGKWEALEEIVHEALGSNLKIVIFTQYLGMIDMIGKWLKSKKVHYVELRGDSRDRGALLTEFANNPECKVFVCSLLAGGLGIDLTAGSVCIHYDRWWNPAKENQATDRLHRIGQTRGVQVFKLQCPGTVEDRIASIIESKNELSGTLIEESPLGLKAFSREELLSLLTDLNKFN